MPDPYMPVPILDGSVYVGENRAIVDASLGGERAARIAGFANVPREQNCSAPVWTKLEAPSAPPVTVPLLPVTAPLPSVTVPLPSARMLPPSARMPLPSALQESPLQPDIPALQELHHTECQAIKECAMVATKTQFFIVQIM